MKILSEKINRQYELTFLVSASLTNTEATKVVTEVEALVAKHQGKVAKKDDWGKKKLAYKIKHLGKSHAEALYTHLVLEFESKQVPAFEKDLKLNQNLIRYLLVVID